MGDFSVLSSILCWPQAAHAANVLAPSEIPGVRILYESSSTKRVEISPTSRTMTCCLSLVLYYTVVYRIGGVNFQASWCLVTKGVFGRMVVCHTKRLFE